MRFIALLRAVNVGGTGKLPMDALRALCADAGFENAQTYIASGNVVFDWAGTAEDAAEALEARLQIYAGAPVGVFVRSGAELEAVLAANPYAEAKGNQLGVLFVDATPSLEGLAGQADEEIALGAREIYIHFPSGMGRSKLKLGAMAQGTMRNLNTVAKLEEMSRR